MNLKKCQFNLLSHHSLSPVRKEASHSVSVISKINNERNVTILIAEDEEINYLYIETLLTEGFKSKSNYYAL